MPAEDVFAFTAMIEPMVWGTATYTIVRIPDAVADAAKAAGSRRVIGTINQTPVNLAITRAPVLPQPFVWAGSSLRRKAGLHEGDLVEVELRVADAHRVDVPDDVARALADGGVRGEWDDLSPADRRRRLYAVDSKRTERSRAQAITALVDTLTGN